MNKYIIVKMADCGLYMVAIKKQVHTTFYYEIVTVPMNYIAALATRKYLRGQTQLQ